MTLLDRVLKNEGFKPKPYLDSIGVSTIGHGLTHVTREESKAIVDARLKRYAKNLKTKRPWIARYPVEVREILVEMNFQLGTKGTNEFKKMFAAIKKKDFNLAAAEMRDSKWSNQTPDRCDRLATRMGKA